MGQQYKIRRLIRSQPRSIDSGLKFHVRGVEQLVSNLTSRSTSDGSSTPADHDQHNVPANVVIIIIAAVSILLILSLSTGLVFYLRHRKPRRMEMTEADVSGRRSVAVSVTSEVTVQSLDSLKYPPFLANYNRGAAIQSRLPNAIPRPAVKTQPAPATIMPRLTESSIVPVLPTMFFPELEVFRSPSPGVQNSLARPGQQLKVVNTTPGSDIGPVPQVLTERSQKMSYTDLPKIRTDFVKKDGKIIIPPSKPASMESTTLSRASSRDTANSAKPQGPRPLPFPRALHPGYRGNEPQLKSMDVVFY